ncbi:MULTISPECIES: xanthine dehydrogenase family protein molybdopterin-binding subunit [Burkholderiaceae]|uniref:Periplasmic aromatic aldehyde oxidoreductase, molybdenum binding subunit YagR n=1 Tax=Caballeronia sordidicola TaxID=196367 RepID=A0A242MP14_CABSO|nr:MULTISPECIES: xanthine dehydrogenase family protein molybdopterin-binding subunit [Burkholderiaceae]AME25886.1 acylaldehyde oxidase [Burkholderia sp. PAMC 26561]OTP72732.1 Periplasmic aromatic aldehyde oxidoreductase, molybdenum binding subunit YagR [Caballeronia sordidicola]
MSVLGQPLDRTDGLLKVTGQARYSADNPEAKLAHAVLVTSTIARGRVLSMDTARVQSMPGVLLVMTHETAMRLPNGGKPDASPPAVRRLTLLQTDEVRYSNEPVAVVVADTLERATDGARKLQASIKYEAATPNADYQRAKGSAYRPEKMMGRPIDTQRGDVAAGLRQGPTRLDVVYTTPNEHHNPMEPHATLARWDGPKLTLYDATQGVSGARSAVAKTLGISEDDVRVICPFVGGGFGCKGSAWSHVVLAAMAAKQTGRPVRLVLERPQMFGMVGNRPFTEQHFQVAARDDGTLTGMRHDVISTTSTFEDWNESSAILTRMLYATPNQATTHKLVKLDIGTPTFMRAPGETSGSFALESAMDEMAYQLNMDPLALRLKNYADMEPQEKKPWSEKSLRECYEKGAAKFGWSRRNPKPRSMQQGNTLIGWGMATATYPANRSEASAVVRILPDGTAMAASGTQDLGTGTFTVMTQVAADALGFPMEMVTFALGDSSLPKAPVSGGSQSAASVSPAVREAASQARGKLIAMAIADSGSPLAGASADDVTVNNGWVISRADPAKRDPAAAIIARNGGKPIEATATVKPGDEKKEYAFHSFGAVFAEVHVDADLGTIRVARVVSVYDVGSLLNEKTAHSQLMGGVVWGIGSALTEKSELDPRYGRYTNANLAEYHVPVNADINTIDITVLGQTDPHINSLGVRGIGEIGITGVAGAIANAVYHATGVRVRDLPITLDKVMPKTMV